MAATSVLMVVVDGSVLSFTAQGFAQLVEHHINSMVVGPCFFGCLLRLCVVAFSKEGINISLLSHRCAMLRGFCAGAVQASHLQVSCCVDSQFLHYTV